MKLLWLLAGVIEMDNRGDVRQIVHLYRYVCIYLCSKNVVQVFTGTVHSRVRNHFQYKKPGGLYGVLEKNYRKLKWD